MLNEFNASNDYFFDSSFQLSKKEIEMIHKLTKNNLDRNRIFPGNLYNGCHLHHIRPSRWKGPYHPSHDRCDGIEKSAN